MNCFLRSKKPLVSFSLPMFQKTLHCPGLVLDLVVDLEPALDLAPEQPEPDCTSLYTVYVLTSTHVYLVIWPRSF